MRYVEAPYRDSGHVLFLAGGITDCPDWQRVICDDLTGENLIVLNPRRDDFPINDPNASYEQIKWEFDMLREASMISFWFPKETLCPIVLYELGAWSMTEKPLFVGVDPQYKRADDVEIQTALIRPDVEIVTSLSALADQVRGFIS